MPARDLGNKHICFKCSTRFYDLKKPAPLCPKCGADQRQVPASKGSSAAEKRRTPAKPAAPAHPVADEAETEAVLNEELDEEEDADEPEEADEQ